MRFLRMAALACFVLTAAMSAAFAVQGSLDPAVAEVIRAQLSTEEAAMLSDPAALEQELEGVWTEGLPVLRVFTEIYWEKAGLTLEELTAWADACSGGNGFRDYVVFAEEPFRIRAISGDGALRVGLADDFRNGVPRYIADIASSAGTVSFRGAKCVIEGISCFDALSLHMGAAVYFNTDKGVLVKYYEYADSEGELFSGEDFAEKAAAYNEYLTSYEHNYNENGEALGGAAGFAGFLKERYDTRGAQMSGLKYAAAAFGVLALAAAAGALVARGRKEQ